MTIEFLSVADRRVAYQRQVAENPRGGVVFLGGFASDMEGGKAQHLAAFCAGQRLDFVRFDYSGCGQSPGRFTDGTIGAWRDDSLAVLDQLTRGAQIIIGSSMGGWLGLLLALARPQRLKGFIGIAAAPDFTEDLVWDKLTATQRATLLREGKIYEDDAPPDHRVPMTLKLIEEARAHLVLRSPLPVTTPVRLLQGMKDKEVPWQTATRLADHITQDDVRVTLIKNGDHRLSTPENLKVLEETVAALIG